MKCSPKSQKNCKNAHPMFAIPYQGMTPRSQWKHVPAHAVRGGRCPDCLRSVSPERMAQAKALVKAKTPIGKCKV